VLKDARAVYTPGISERASGTSKFYHADALGSTRGITNGSQTVTDAILYDAFGMTVSRTGSTPTPFGFVGAAQYQSDADSGLQLLGNRLYDPSIGRFISSDPAKAGTSWYCYCENGPLARTDPSGHSLIGWLIDKVIGWVTRRAAKEAARRAIEKEAARETELIMERLAKEAAERKAVSDELIREGKEAARRSGISRDIEEGRKIARQEAIDQQKRDLINDGGRTPPNGPDIGGIVAVVDPTPISDVIGIIKENKGRVGGWIDRQTERAKHRYGMDEDE